VGEIPPYFSRIIKGNQVIKVIRIYQHESGYWHIEIERDGVLRYSSLKTNNEKVAQQKMLEYQHMLNGVYFHDNSKRN